MSQAHAVSKPIAGAPRQDAGLGLVGDIGGTNARFALTDLSKPDDQVFEAQSFACRDFPNVHDAVAASLEQRSPGRMPTHVVLAVAGPVVDGAIAFTNMSWRFSERDLRALGFGQAKLINDFAALAVAAPTLGEADARPIGGLRNPEPNQNLAVLGAGTGFGVSALARDEHGATPMATEGGHAAFAPNDDVETEVLRFLRGRFGRVSLERILSGPGLANLHEALAAVDGRQDVRVDPAEITRLGLAGDQDCRRTLDRFCAILGCVAGDLALTYGAKGGVFITGGVVAHLIDILEPGPFRRRFEAKGRFVPYLEAIPTWVITRPHVALSGAARVLHALARAG